MIRFILGLIVGAGAMAFSSSPFGKSVLTAFVAQLLTPPAIVVTAASPAAIEEELPPPLVSTAILPPASVVAPAAAPAAVAETEPADTYRRVMEIYEQDGKAPVEEGGEIEQLQP